MHCVGTSTIRNLEKSIITKIEDIDIHVEHKIKINILKYLPWISW